MPCYDVTNLGTTSTFQDICMEKYMRKKRKKLLSLIKKNITFHQLTQFWPFLAKLLAKMKQKLVRKKNYFFIFSRFFWTSWPKFMKTSVIWEFSVPKNPENINISKICLLQIFCFFFAYNLAENVKNLVNR